MTDFSRLQLTTPRLRLRPLQAGDEPALWAIYSDPLVMRFWSTPPWSELQQAEAMIAADAEHLPAGRHARLALEPLDGGPVIGTCTLFDFVPQSRRCEIGYALGHAHWGRGLMHEALRALIGLAFGELALRRIEADIDPRNAGSARTLERLGFVREGLLRERWLVGEEISDTALYGLLRRDWQAPASAT